MKLPEALRILFLLAAAALFAARAEATISRAVSFDEKVERAASIVLARAISQHSDWDAQREWILTYTTFRIEKVLKGFPAQEVTVVTPGGRVGDIAQEVVGVPRFEIGDDHVVFVRNTSAGPTVLFLEQGAYDVFEGERGERLVRPVAQPPVVMDSQRGAAVEAERVQSLRDFEGSVRETIRRREAMRMEMLERQKREEASSLRAQVRRNRLLIALALIGVALATWQFLRRV